jgi:hypothetical protein
MRQILSRSLLTVAAASSILAATGGYADADTGAEGVASGSPGVLSGNSVQAPVDIPVNACGNTVDAVAAGNPAFGDHCANASGIATAASDDDSGHREHPVRADRAGHADDGRYGGGSVATGSPGVLSGNAVDIPVRVPVNACGNAVDAVGLLNPAMGNSCGSAEQASSVGVPGRTVPPGTTEVPPEVRDVPPAVHARTPDRPIPAPRTEQVLAETGVNGRQVGAAGATSAALLLGGAMLYRRGVRPAPAGRTR